MRARPFRIRIVLNSVFLRKAIWPKSFRNGMDPCSESNGSATLSAKASLLPDSHIWENLREPDIVRTRGGQLEVLGFHLYLLALLRRLCRVVDSMHAIPDHLAHLLTDKLLELRQRLRRGHADTVVANHLLDGRQRRQIDARDAHDTLGFTRDSSQCKMYYRGRAHRSSECV